MTQRSLQSSTLHVLCVGARIPGVHWAHAEASLAELQRLVDTAGGVVQHTQLLDVRKPASATLIPRGSVDNIAAWLEQSPADMVAVDAELTPAQQRNLADAWGVAVVDRTAVILDIFAQRARTQAGKLQVELAQLKYRLPRLSGRGQNFMQQAGYIGNRGPGETKLEMDRRRIRERITHLRRQLKDLTRHRALHHAGRDDSGLPTVALVGYTNAGKSTLFNRVTAASVLVEDRLFATLDPTVRRAKLPGGRQFLLVDTVGFIRHLPHQLVEAFKSTFAEVAHADLLLHLIDAHDPEAHAYQQVVTEVLQELDCGELPQLVVWNKCDEVADDAADTTALRISAQTGLGVDILLEHITTVLSANLVSITCVLPHTAGQWLHHCYAAGDVIAADHQADGIHLTARLPTALAVQIRAAAQ